MKKIIFLIIFLIIIPYTSANWVYDSSNLVLDLDMSSEINIVHLTSDYSLKYIIVNLSFLPQESFNQEILRLDTSPKAELVDDSALFRWDEPDEEKLEFSLKSRIKTDNNYKRIKNKIEFPIDAPSEVISYTKPSETVDSDNSRIIKLASKLAEGEDDLFVVVYNLADWVKTNIEYDLSTLTASVSQKASWVLDNKEGVCDEITNLFIALNRALGIPAKFVSGVVYSSSPETKEKWGPHGWAEVYFPGYGWISFDVTFGELGFINPTHIKLKEAIDANEPSTQYQWLGHDVIIETEKLDIKTELKETLGKEEPKISLGIDAEKKNIGFGSYNLIEVAIENLKDYYVATELQLAKSEEVEIIDKKIKSILLKPNEKKNAYWTIKLTKELDRNYKFTLPVAVVSLDNISKEIKFSSNIDDPIFSLTEITEILKQRHEEKEKVYSKNIDLNCNIDKKMFYEYEKAIIECYIKNKGNIFLENLNVCLKDYCKTIDLGINQDWKLDFLIKNKVIGKQEAMIKAENKDISKAVYVEYTLMDTPKIEITNLEYPNETLFDNVYKISFILNKKSKFNPKNVLITLNQNGFAKKWELSQLAQDREFIVNLNGNELSSKKNKFEMIIDYKDNNEQEYKEEKEFHIDLVNITFTQRVRMFINKIESWLLSISS